MSSKKFDRLVVEACKELVSSNTERTDVLLYYMYLAYKLGEQNAKSK